MKKVAVALFILGLSASIYCQDSYAKFWKSLDNDSKSFYISGYIRGYSDGTQSVLALFNYSLVISTKTIPQASFSEIEKAFALPSTNPLWYIPEFDAFYSIRDNANKSLLDCLAYIQNKYKK